MTFSLTGLPRTAADGRVGAPSRADSLARLEMPSSSRESYPDVLTHRLAEQWGRELRSWAGKLSQLHL